MGELSETALDLQAAFSEAVRRQDFDDLQNEMAGRETGRMERFLSPDERERIKDGKSKGERHAEAMTRLQWMLANDALYREAHKRAMTSIDDAGQAIARAIEAGERAAAKIQRDMEDYLASTPRLKDGRYVMVDEDGTYRDQNREPVSAEDAAEIEGQPKRAFRTYDEMLDRKESIDRDLTELRGWEVDVGGMRNEATDEDSLASRERVEQMTEQADDLAERAKEIQRGFENSSPNDDPAQAIQQDARADQRAPSLDAMALPKL